MEIFCRLLFGHLLADFTFQTNYIAEWKRHSFYGLLAHVFIHPLCYIPLTYPFINDTWVVIAGVPLNGWACIAIATVLHFIEDWFRVNKVNKGWTDNTLFYLWDQLIHILVIWVLTPTRTQAVIDPWPILGILFVLVTHFATVTVWFIEKDIYGRTYPETEEKYISMLQRLVVWLTFFLPHPLWLFGVAFFMVTFFRHIWKRRVDFSWCSVILGNMMAVGCGLIARFGVGTHF